MLNFLKDLFNTEKVDMEEIIKNGALIVDVRSRAEFECLVDRQ